MLLPMIMPQAFASVARLLARPASPVVRVLLVAVNLAAIAFFLLSYTRHGIGFAPYRIDLDVYQIGGRVWLRGGNLYGVLPATSGGVRLPFSYPPIAAVLLSPLSLVPLAVAGTGLTLSSIALTALVLRVFLRSAAGPEAGSWWTIGWLLPAALFLEPVQNTLNYGQVNVVLMALVSLDCLPAAVRWPRGAGVGLAAAVKLTPAAFVLFFLLRGDRRAAGTAAVSFAASGAAGFLLAWHDSVRYWTSVVFQTGRPGSPIYAANQSIQAVLGRAGLDPRTPAGMAAWLAASAVVLALACAGMRRALASSQDAWALSLNAFAALLISPVSWSHHWVWGETGLLVLVVRGHTLRQPRHGGLVIAVAGLAVFAAAPQWRLPHGANRELHWAAWQQVIGSSYVILAVVILLLSAVRWRGRSDQAQARSPSRARAAGTRMPRTTVASMRTAAAVPTPRIFRSTKGMVTKIEKTATMIRAALVTTPALEAMPPMIACSGDEPRAHSSRTRLRMNTW
jgi:alpha-1,2-mannosyltransferase